MPTTTQQKRPPSLGQVERLKDLRQDVTERLETVEARLDAITSELAGLRVEGDEASDEAKALREERAEFQDERDELEATLPALDQRIEEVAEQACAAEAEKALSTLVKRIGGQVGAHGQDGKRVRELTQKLRETLARMEKRPAVVGLLKAQLDALCRRFDLERPETKPMPDQAQQIVRRLRKKAGKLGDGPEKLPEAPVGLDRIDPVAAAAVSADRLEALGEDAPSVEILEKLGERTSARPEDHRAANRAERKAIPEENWRAAVGEVKAWMAPRVSGGKVNAHDLYQQAQAQQFEGVRKVRPGLDKVVEAAAEELGLVQAQGPTGIGFWLRPEEMEPHLTEV